MPPSKYLGAADEIEVRGDENGFELHFATDDGVYVVNVHARSRELLDSVTSEIGTYWDEAEAARRSRPVFACNPDESGGYDRDDPKHADWHSVHADLYDSREGK